MKSVSALFHGIGLFLCALWMFILKISEADAPYFPTPWLPIVGFILVGGCFICSLVYDAGANQKESQPENEQETDDIDVIPLPGDD